MNSEPRDTSEQLVELIVRAREGSADAMGELVESCRPYLLLIANQELDRGLQAKLGASDIVQETLLQARRDIATFKGNSQKELIAWLRQILLHEVTDTRRHFYDTVKRDARREQAMPNDHSILEHPAEFSSRRLTPSSEATVREEAIALRAAIATMPPESIEVIKLRNWRQLSWPEIGQQMGRSPEAARKLWSRSLKRLRSELYDDDGPDSARQS